MLNRLFVVTNLFIFLEEYSVCDNNEEYFDYVWLSDRYVREPMLRLYVSELLPDCVFINDIDLFSQFFDFDIVVSPSNIGDGSLIPFRTRRYALVEEGSYDFETPASQYKDNDIRRKCELYTTKLLRPDVARLYKKADILHFDDDMTSRINELFADDLAIAELFTHIFITSPLLRDFGISPGEVVRLIEQDYPGADILVKPHPRDDFLYQSNIVRFTTLHSQVPAQLILKKMVDSGKKPDVIYDFPSTVFFHTNISGKMYKIKTDNKKYNDAFLSSARIR